MRSVDRTPDPLWHGLPAALGVVGRLGRVELKVMVDACLEEAMSVLDAHVEPPLLRRVHFLDTPNLSLARDGIHARVRETRPGGGGRGTADIAVRLRRPVPSVRRVARGTAVELDALPTAVIWSASSRRLVDPGRVSGHLTGRSSVLPLISKAQRRLLLSTPEGTLDLEQLVAHGPVEVVRFRSAGPEIRVVVESWRFPDGARIVEVSVKCRPARSHRIAEAVRVRIAAQGLAISDRQSTKTEIALQVLTGLDLASGRERQMIPAAGGPSGTSLVG